MAKKKTNPEVESVADVSPQPVAESVTEDKQPLSLEDALAVAEQATSEFESAEVSPKKRKKTDGQTADEIPDDEVIGAASYNPDLVIADLESDVPSIASDALSSLTPEEKCEVMLEDAVSQAEEELAEVKAEQQIEEHLLPDAKAVIEAYAEATYVTPSDDPEPAGTPIADIPETEPIVTPPEVDMGVPSVSLEKAEEIASIAAAKKPAAKKKAPAKKSTKTEAVPDEEAPATDAQLSDEKSQPSAEEKDNSKEVKTEKSRGKKTKNEPVVETKPDAVDETVAKPAKDADKPKKKHKKLEPEQNFKLLKILIIALSLIAAGISGHVFYKHIYDFSTGFAWFKLIPIVPLAVQVLLLLVSLITVGTSKRKPIGSVIKANAAEKKANAAEKEENRINKEISDNLLVPEVPLTPRKTVELSNIQLDNFYKKSVEEINGKYYMQVTKFDDSMKVFEARGATDMELVAVNMVGGAKFTEILDLPRSKTLSSKELVSYFLSKPGTFAIKKRGALDWTFKYCSKSFGIIRENDDSYKVSIKCFPDAANKLNDVYKALEDSNFPSGPLWFCFNELRNLPPRVCKWLIDTSCQISKYQQIKTDVLKDDKTLADYDINLADIAEKYKAGETVINYPKFTIIFSKGDDADLTTYLTREKEGVVAENFTKEFYYKFTKTSDSVSVLCPSKGVSEDIIICLFDNIESIVK